MRYLRGRSNDHDLVFEEIAVGIVRVPEFRIENFIKGPRAKNVWRAKANLVRLQIARHILGVAKFLEDTGRKRFIDLLARMRWQTGKLAIRNCVANAPDFLIERVLKNNHVTHAIVSQLGRRN